MGKKCQAGGKNSKPAEKIYVQKEMKRKRKRQGKRLKEGYKHHFSLHEDNRTVKNKSRLQNDIDNNNNKNECKLCNH